MTYARKAQPQPCNPPRLLQRKLYQAAQRSRNRRFHVLDDCIFWPNVLWRAWREVRLKEGGVLTATAYK